MQRIYVASFSLNGYYVMVWLFAVALESHAGGCGCAGVLQPGHIGGHSINNGEGM